jgi:GT2 family glycosyltransferase
MYAEDMDLCVKIAKAGWQIHYVPSAMIIHYGGGSSSWQTESHFSDIVLRESLVQYFTIYRGEAYTLLYRLSIFSAAIVRLIILAALFPLWLHRRGHRPLTSTIKKWLVIMTWSVGISRWVNTQRQALVGIMPDVATKP